MGTVALDKRVYFLDHKEDVFFVVYLQINRMMRVFYSRILEDRTVDPNSEIMFVWRL